MKENIGDYLEDKFKSLMYEFGEINWGIITNDGWNKYINEQEKFNEIQIRDLKWFIDDLLIDLLESKFNKEVVPYDLSLKLISLGFDEKDCFCYYDNNGDLSFELRGSIYDDIKDNIVLAPTFSQAFEWMERKYLLFLCRDIITSSNEVLEIIYKIKSLTDSWDVGFDNYLEDFDNYKTKIACLTKMINIINENT